MSTLVTLGNAHQRFDRLLEWVWQCLDLLPAPVLVQHGHTPCANSDVDARAFISGREFSEAVQRAHLVICHAGAGSIIHSVQAGRQPVVVARRGGLGEHIDDHQLELAEALAGAGKVAHARNFKEFRHLVTSQPAQVARPPIQGNELIADLTRLVARVARQCSGAVCR